MKKIIIFAAHPDDEILGLGGTMCRYKSQGYKIKCIIMAEGQTSRKEKRELTNTEVLRELYLYAKKASEIIGYDELVIEQFPDNRMDSVDLLDVIKVVEKHIDEYKPDIVFTHHYGDQNIDHRILNDAVITATRPMEGCSVKEVYSFETPSSTEWSFATREKAFKPNFFVDVTEYMGKKIKAMECYKSEIRAYPHPRSIEALKIIAARWGTVVGKKYVEAFEMIRKIEG